MNTKRAISQVWSNPWHFIAFGFGSGVLPVMPGTYGTLVAVPIYLLLQNLPILAYGIVCVLITVFGAWLSEKVSKEIGIHDYPGMNFDEIVGFLVTMFAAPKGWFWIALGFGLFRVFDILKPGPIKWVDKHIKGGIGVVLDDCLAAFCAWTILQLVAILFSKSLLFA